MTVLSELDRNIAFMAVVVLLAILHYRIRKIKHEEAEEEARTLARENRRRCGACKQRIPVQDGVFVEHRDGGKICGGSQQPPETMKKYLPPS